MHVKCSGQLKTLRKPYKNFLVIDFWIAPYSPVLRPAKPRAPVVLNSHQIPIPVFSTQQGHSNPFRLRIPCRGLESAAGRNLG